MSILSRIRQNLRSYGRSQCSHEFELYVLDKGTLVASLMDISRSGCRIMVDGAIDKGDFIMLAFTKENAVDATVIWTKGSVVGCEFASPLSRIAVRVILDRCKGVGSAGFGHGDVNAPNREDT